MLKIVFTSTVFALSTFQASAEAPTTYDLSVLTPDVAARVAELQEYGTRFDAAIRAIIAAASLPSSGFDGCGDDQTQELTLNPES